MARVNVVFYSQFSKQPNSTLTPQNVSPPAIGRTFSCILWEGLSIMAPTLELVLKSNGDTFEVPTDYNYCYIADFQRYYWVLDWKMTDNVWNANLQVDVLASFKSDIANCYVFATRLGDRRSYNPDTQTWYADDTGMMDNMLPTRARPHIDIRRYGLDFIVPSDQLYSGTFMLGVLNGDDAYMSGHFGSVFYIFTNAAGVQKLCKDLMAASGRSTPDIDVETIKCIMNPFQYIVSCMYFPIDSSTHWSDLSDRWAARVIRCGWWNIADIVAGVKQSRANLNKCRMIRLNNHPYADMVSGLGMSCLNYEPYATYDVYIPFFGNCILDRSDFPEGKISVVVTVDLQTGAGKCRIYNGWPSTYNEFTDNYDDVDVYDIDGQCQLQRILYGQIGVPIQLGASTSDYALANVNMVQSRSYAAAESALVSQQYAVASSQALYNSAAAQSSAYMGALDSLARGWGGGLISGIIGTIGAATQAQQGYYQAQAIYNSGMAQANAAAYYGGKAASANIHAQNVSATYSANMAKAPKVETRGSTGTTLELGFNTITVMHSFMIPTSIQGHNYDYHAGPSGDVTETKEFLQWAGYPYGKFITIGDHTGFIMGNNPKFNSLTALQPEIEQIKDYITHGFFYE